MTYSQTLTKAKTLLRQQHYAQAVQTTASALEHLLVDLYQEVLGKSPPARQKQLIGVVEQVGQGQPLDKLTLGRLVNVYRASRLHEDLQKTLGLKLTFLRTTNLDPLVSIRNQAVHEGRDPDPAEAAYIVNQVELILRETSRLPKKRRSSARATLEPWWHTAMPHRSIREGRMLLRDFAIDLAQVVEGQAIPEYADPDTFFRRTFFTRGLRDTLKGVLRHLAGEDDGVAITQMATVFGGGKTHTLLALYHVVSQGAAVDYLESMQELLAASDLEKVPTARVVAVDCAHISPSQPRTTPEGIILHTLWGEIAYRLGGADRGAEFYELIRHSDEERVAPGSETLAQLFQLAGPSLVLIDETLSYITKASGIPVGEGYLSDQAQEFLLELTRTVSAAPDVALVLTMTSSEQEQIGDAAIRVARAVDTTIRILRRTRQVEVSAEREELYEILKRRLFDGDPVLWESQARAVAQTYWDYYRAHPSDFPQEAQTPEYRDLMIRSYPFHPALIKTLRDRWGSISGFQRTRGVLRLLALVIADLYQAKHSAQLIQPAHVNLDDGNIRAELLEYVDNKGGYESAILSDIGGTDESQAPGLDRITGGDYARYGIATGLATSIFMYSHSGAVQRIASAERPQLWLAMLQPAIVPALAADALDKLQRKLWYLTVDEGSYRIDSQPNLNQILVSRTDAIRQEPEIIRKRVKTAVEEVAGRRVFPKFVVWPKEPAHVLDRRTLTLAILDPVHNWGMKETSQERTMTFIGDVLHSALNTFRQYKNTVVFCVPTAEGMRVAEKTAVDLLALEAIDRQYRSGGLSEAQMENLQTLLDQARKGLPGAVWGAYTVIITPIGETGGKTALRVRQEHGFAGYRPGEHSLARRAWERLIGDERLLDRLDPRLLSEGKGDQWRLWQADEDRINVETLWDYFCRFPYLPMLTGPEALQQTIAWGVQRGLFAYALGDGETFDTIYFDDSRPSTDFPIVEGSWLLRPVLAEQLLKQTEPEPQPTPGSTPRPEPQPGPDLPPTTFPRPGPQPPVTPPPSVYRRITIDTPVDWRQWYDFYQAVIQPLVESGADINLELHLVATGELDANLVDLSVKESVVQFDASGKVEVQG